ncbi:MAG: efflux RND transporter periplasmic adaptor subunit [candidate division KSB1 bacterium]|nr:efflux RND transporter periplasmic adaptor subunit [candidate division KSB1 bacterium]MDZ7302430.1 efflux RND transporter periplasmic adaptor subunit [candidate division KSB1 bacterium]MDZ7311632.1 efflux RND transporter periplasmic adaptor subunit [candidate division KSB1 bacterium]
MKELNDLQNTLRNYLADKRHRKTVMLVAPAAVVVLLAGSSLLVSETDDTTIPTARVRQDKVTIKITETGELRAQDQVTISAVTDKQILWLVPEGTWVEEGDTLIKFESEKYILSRGEAESSVMVAKADLVKAQSDLEAMMAKEEAARKTYESLPELAKKGFIQESEVEQAQLTYLELKSRVRSLRAAVDAAKANVDRAARGLAQQERKLRQGVVLAPRAGLVVYAMTGDAENQKKITVGMTPFEGMDLMYLPDISSMMVDTEISEVDLAKVTTQMPVEIRLDAYPDAVFKGEVTYIADLAKRKISRITGKATGAKVFDVTVKVLDQDRRLKPGLTATLDIIVDQYEKALYIPLEAIFLDEQDQTIAYVKHRGKIEVRKITISESNDRVAVIKEGLKEGEEVLLGRPTSI